MNGQAVTQKTKAIQAQVQGKKAQEAIARREAEERAARSHTFSGRKSRIRREWNTVVAVLAREITVFLKSPGTAIMSLAMPLVMMGMIGGNLLQNMAGGLGFSFGPFMLVGMLVNMLFMVTSMGMTSLVDDHESDFNQEMLVSPVSRYSLVIGKILGSGFGAIISMAGTLVVGLLMGITIPLSKLLLVLALSPLMCLSGGALAMIIIGLIKSKKAANLAVMFITMPQMFLSGAIIPIANSEGILMALSRCMPMTYCLDLMRAVVYGGSAAYGQVVMFNPLVSLAVVVGMVVVCLVVGTFFFARTETHR